MAGAYPPCAFGLTREIMYATALGFAGLGVFKVRAALTHARCALTSGFAATS